MIKLSFIVCLVLGGGLLFAESLEDCYTNVFRGCDTFDDNDPCVIEGLAACRDSSRQDSERSSLPGSPSPSTPEKFSCEVLCGDLAAAERKYKEAVNRGDLDAMDSYYEMKKRLKEEITENQCQCPATVQRPAPRPVTRSYNLAGSHSVKLMSSCKKYEAQMKEKISKALRRFEECLQYAYIKEDLEEQMVRAIQGEGILVDCVPPPQIGKCAAAGEGIGLIAIAPKALTSRVCPDIEDIIIHEIAHTANLESELPSPPGRHNYGERPDMYDEVYGISKLCMVPARMWINRRRAGDVVQKGKLDCVRRYIEETPKTLVDPFWIPMKQAVQAGRDPCY